MNPLLFNRPSYPQKSICSLVPNTIVCIQDARQAFDHCPNRIKDKRLSKTGAKSLEDSFPKPKRPRTAYNLFFRDQQKELNKLKSTGAAKRSINVAEVVSSSWHKAPASVQMHYHQLAADDKFRYYREKQEYDEEINRRKIKVELSPKLDTEDECPSSLSDNLFPRCDSFVENEESSPLINKDSIAQLASQLDPESIAFLVRALK